MNQNFSRNPELADRITIVPFAVWGTSGEIMNFADSGPGSHLSSNGGVLVETISIDDFIDTNEVSKIDFIKMDIEGSEANAIKGAANSIRRFKPKLAISAYHKIDDLLTLPSLIRRIEPSYEFFLEHYTVHQEETVLYAVSKERAGSASSGSAWTAKEQTASGWYDKVSAFWRKSSFGQ